MLKKLLNRPERITYDRLREVCARHVAEVYAKVRLADVLPIEGSGLTQELYEFALQAHYDFVVTGRDQVPLFAIEFDGPQHGHLPQAERDAKKDELSRRYWLPMLRVGAEDLRRTESQLDRLTELIERWFEGQTELASGSVNGPVKPLCPQCGAKMVEKYGKYGRFLGCSRYPSCTGTCDLPRPLNRTNALGWSKVLIAGSICTAVVVVVLALLLRLHDGWPQGGGADKPPGAETRPAVAGTRSAMTAQEQRAYARALKESDYPACPLCGKRMVLRNNTKTGDPFFGCSEFPRCRGTRDVQYPK
jgi:ssDNA-binding Zn-finger/Zn-ribbon topoisomerase 1